MPYLPYKQIWDLSKLFASWTFMVVTAVQTKFVEKIAESVNFSFEF